MCLPARYRTHCTYAPDASFIGRNRPTVVRWRFRFPSFSFPSSPSPTPVADQGNRRPREKRELNFPREQITNERTMKNNKDAGFSWWKSTRRASTEVVKLAGANAVPFARLQSFRIKIRNGESFAALRSCISFSTKTQVKR